EQQHALPAIHALVQCLHSAHGHVEAPQVLAEQEGAIEDGGCEGVDVPGDFHKPGRAAEYPGQVSARVAALGGPAQQEVERDRHQEQAREPAPGAGRQAADQADREPPAALAAALPLNAHAACAATSPLATRSPSRITWKRQRPSALGSSAIVAAWPGSSGRANFTCGRRRPCSGPCADSIAASTCSSTTTPGTTGRPGKWPGRLGWSCAIENCIASEPL